MIEQVFRGLYDVNSATDPRVPITGEIRLTAIHAVEHPSAGISTARLRPSGRAISSENRLLPG
jgi:hypothetical protein